MKDEVDSSRRQAAHTRGRLFVTGIVCFVVVICTGCGPYALYLRSPSGRYFERAVTLESVPKRDDCAQEVGDIRQPGGEWVGLVFAPEGSDSSLFEGLHVWSDSVVLGEANVKLDLVKAKEGEFFGGAFARCRAQTMVVDIISFTLTNYRWYGDAYHHRIVIDMPSARTEYRKERLARNFCRLNVGAAFRPDGRLEVAFHQEAVRGLFLIPIPFGTIEKTSLLVEKELPFAGESDR
jgi:hypothetical protein